MRFSLGSRIFAMTAILVALAVGTAVAVTWLLGGQIARDAARQALDRSASLQTSLRHQRQDQLRLLARVFAGDRHLAGYIAEGIEAGERASILDLLEERQNDLGFDFAIALDHDGRVVVRTDDPDAVGEDLLDDPLVDRAFEDFDAYGVWRQGDALYDAVAVPLVADRLLVGFLIAGFAVDDLTAIEVRRGSHTEVAFLAGTPAAPRPAATTLDAGLLQDLFSALAGKPGTLERVMVGGESVEHLELELRGRRWLALLQPITDAAGAPVGAAVSLASLEDELAPFRRIETTLAAVGALAIALALALSFLFSRRLMRPVRELAAAAEAASGGDYRQQIQVERSDEVGQLARSLDSLLSELREKEDMEAYIGELARTMPAQGGPGGRVEEPTRRQMAFLLLELRRYGQGSAAVDPEETVERLGRDLRRVAAAAGGHQGRVEGVFGQRVLVSFDGTDGAYQAFSCAAELLPALDGGSALEEPSPPVAALAQGEAVAGSVVWGAGPERALVGKPMQQLDSLLREASPGDLVMAQGFYQQVGEAFERSGLELAAQRGVFSTQAIYVLNGAMAGRVTGQVAPPRGVEVLDTPAIPVATLSEISPGKVLGDRFEILSVLGAGGMGVVYKVRDRELDDLVALKMLKGEVWEDGEQLERLKSELKLARKITHPNVLRTFDFGEIDGIPFISMEYVPGVTLRALLRQSGRLPYSAGLRLARQLCRGLESAHQMGVLHRDIKPENLIVQPNGNAKLMDFGIARPISRVDPGQTQPGTVLGTPYYMAPEQLQGKEPDHRADLYACGVVLYELFTGVLPFTGDNPMEIILATLQEPPPSPKTYWPEIPPPLESLILRSLEKDPSRRHSSVSELLAELENLRA